MYNIHCYTFIQYYNDNNYYIAFIVLIRIKISTNCFNKYKLINLGILYKNRHLLSKKRNILQTCISS